MVYMWIDDLRPAPANYFEVDDPFYCVNTVDNAIKIIRSEYKQGNTTFFLDIDNDAGEEFAQHGGDYINILRRLEDMRHGGHLRNIQIQIKIHSMNPVAVQNMRNIIRANSDWMKEIF